MWILDFFKKQTIEKPTDKQLKYASKLGIKVTSKMSRLDVSNAISLFEKKNPQLKRQREHIKEKQRSNKYGQEIVRLEAWWNEFAEDKEFMLAIYRYKSDVVVDVLQVNGADIDNAGKIVLEVCAPKLLNDRHIGKYLDWDRAFELSLVKLLHYEPMNKNFCNEEIEVYTAIVKQGLKTAKSLVRKTEKT